MNELHASNTVAAKVRQQRIEHGWSMRELADKAGLAEDAIEAIENGRRRRGVTVDEVMVLAHALRMPAILLLPGDFDYWTDEEKQRANEAAPQRDAEASRRREEWQALVGVLQELPEALEVLAKMGRTLEQIPPGAVLAIERDGKLVPVE